MSTKIRTIHWNENYGLNPETGIKNMFEKKSGNVADINLLLINLLKKAGIDAKPFAIKPRTYGLLNASYPSRTELTYILALVDTPEKSFLADATSKETPLGLLPLRAINMNGLLIDRDNSSILDYQNPNTYQEQTIGTYVINFDEECLDGTGKSKKNAYASMKYRLELLDKDDDDQDVDETDDDEEEDDEDDEEEDEDEVDLKEDKFEVIDVTDIDDIYTDIQYEFEETEYDCLKLIGDQIFIDADFDFGITKNPFSDELREFPIFYNSQNDIRRIFKLAIPEGYEVESYPEKTVLALADDKANFIYEVKNLGSDLLVTYIFKIKNVIIMPNEYPNLKAFYDLAIKKQTEKIILKKI